MQTYMRDMKVLSVRRPYPGATGLQFEVWHPQGTVYAVYRDMPWPVEKLTAVPLIEGDGVFLLREGDWWCYLLRSAGFESPGRALMAAKETARQYVEIHGFTEPLNLDGPMATEVLKQLVDAVRD